VSDSDLPAAPAVTFDSPSGVWFAIEAGRQSGPWSVSALHDRVSAGLVGADTLVWTDGLADWTPFNEVFAADASLRRPLEGQGTLAPPGAEPVVVATAIDPELPGTPPLVEEGRTIVPQPWVRWFARILDMWTVAFVFGAVLAAAGREMPGGQLGDTLAVMLLIVPFEAAWQSSLGTTPGKSLLNVRVRERDGQRLSWPRALRRAIDVWLVGMACGIPLVSLLTMSRQYSALRRDGIATYDAREGFVVTHGPVTRGRAVFLTVLVVVLMSLLVIGVAATADKGLVP